MDFNSFDLSPFGLAGGSTCATSVVAHALSLTSLTTLIKLLPDAILICKENGCIVLLNEQVERSFGYSKSELLGEKVEKLIPKYARGHSGIYRKGFFQEAVGTDKQFYCLRFDGLQVPVEIKISSIQLLEDKVSPTENGEMGKMLAKEGVAENCTKIEIPLSPKAKLAPEFYVIVTIRDVTNRQREHDALARLAAIVDASMDGILTKSLDGILASWNPACESMFGYSALEAVGKNVAMLYPPEELKHETKVLQRIALGEVVATREVVRVHKNGRRIWVSVSTAAQRDDTGCIIGAITIYRDITTIKQAQERFHGLLESAPDATVVVNSNDRIVFVNKQAVNLFGHERSAMLGQPAEMLLPPRFRHADHRASFFQSASAHLMGPGKQLSAFRADGTEVPVDICLSFLDDTEEGPLVTAAIRDVTDRVESERKLEAALLSAEAAARAKSLFLASMSHELRTPLNAVLGMAQLLADSSLSTEQQECVSTLRLSSEHLLGLISDLLDFSKIESTELVLLPEMSDPIEIAEEALEIIRARAQLRNLKLIFQPAKEIPRLMLDPFRLRQIFLNYLTNAIKYTDEGEIKLDLDWKDIGDGLVELHVWVSDTGIGISIQDQDRLFKPFSQLKEGLSHAQGGVGLGLSICRHLAHLMGGKTWVQSKSSQGATFHATIVASPVAFPRVKPTELKVCGVTEGIVAQEKLKEQSFDLVIADEYTRNHWPIPLVVTSSSGAAQTAGSTLAKGIFIKPIRRRTSRSTITRVSRSSGSVLLPRRILVAEDNPVNQLVATKMLSRLGQTAIVVANGQEAVKAVASGEFDLVFMDVNMPLQNGIEATREIRGRSGCQPTIVAMTADTLPENLQCCQDAGMDDIIVKPISMEGLVRVIELVSPAPPDQDTRR